MIYCEVALLFGFEASIVFLYCKMMGYLSSRLLYRIISIIFVGMAALFVPLEQIGLLRKRLSFEMASNTAVSIIVVESAICALMMIYFQYRCYRLTRRRDRQR